MIVMVMLKLHRQSKGNRYIITSQYMRSKHKWVIINITVVKTMRRDRYLILSLYIPTNGVTHAAKT